MPWASSRGAKVVAAVLAPGWKLNLWDGVTGKLLASHGIADDVHRLCFSPDGAALAAVDRQGDVHLIDRMTGAIRRIACGHAESPGDTRIAFSPDSTRLATVGLGVATGAEPHPVSIWTTAQPRSSRPTRPDFTHHIEFTWRFTENGMVNNRAEQTSRHAAVPAGEKRGLKSRISYLVSQFKQNSKTKYPFFMP